MCDSKLGDEVYVIVIVSPGISAVSEEQEHRAEKLPHRPPPVHAAGVCLQVRAKLWSISGNNPGGATIVKFHLELCSTQWLLSIISPFSYRDKMEKVGINSVDLGYYYKRHGKAMVAKYRREARRRFGEDFFSADNNFGSPVKNSRGKRVEGLPVFWEFVQYVKRSPMADEHWAPVYR